MPLEPAESAAIRVTWTDPELRYDLRWYGAADFVVPMWWIGISDTSGELELTEVLAPKLELPGEVFRWLAPLIGHEAAGHLVSLAASVAASAPTAPDTAGTEPARYLRRRHAREAATRRRRVSADPPIAMIPSGMVRRTGRTGRPPARAS